MTDDVPSGPSAAAGLQFLDPSLGEVRRFKVDWRTACRCVHFLARDQRGNPLAVERVFKKQEVVVRRHQDFVQYGSIDARNTFSRSRFRRTPPIRRRTVDDGTLLLEAFHDLYAREGAIFVERVERITHLATIDIKEDLGPLVGPEVGVEDVGGRTCWIVCRPDSVRLVSQVRGS
ncbi:MAG TPA: hypothetical protein VG929_09765 [Actinomycetota bacterium]|nr:hypothetical protein [Actinomycetota bacterium]